MPAGCEFVCYNGKCKYYGCGFVLTGPWGIGNIGLVIESTRVKEMPEYREHLIELKRKGKRTCCIRYPDVDGILVMGYRVQTFCPDCCHIYDHEVILKEGETLEEALKDFPLKRKCDECGAVTEEFDEIVEDGVCCPHCGETLDSMRWFSNEAEGERK